LEVNWNANPIFIKEVEREAEKAQIQVQIDANNGPN
jgi:hypothetical protein